MQLLKLAVVALASLAAATTPKSGKPTILRVKKSDGADWMPGDFGTLRIAEKVTQHFFSLQEGEIWNSRIAMLAVLGYVAQEFVTKVPTVNTIPFPAPF